MKIYRNGVGPIVVAVCSVTLLLLMVSYIDTNIEYSSSNAETRTLDDNDTWRHQPLLDERAERVDIKVEYFTDQTFEVWLVDSAIWNRSQEKTGPVEWLGHGIAGEGMIEWSVSGEQFEEDLLIVQESMDWGQIDSFDADEARYDWEMTVRSIVNPMDSNATWAMLFLIGLSIVLLVLVAFLPREEVPDFKDLYPDYPDSLSPAVEGSKDP